MGETREAGRELDARVAEKVMGFCRDGQPKDCDGNFGGEEVLMRPGETWDSLAREGYYPPPRGRVAFDAFVPRYSTNITDAWLVVEKMRADGWEFMLSAARSPVVIGPWCARYWFWDAVGLESKSMVDDEADTAPLAICLAALQAVDFARRSSRGGEDA